jgi:hypothetical protein
LGVPVVIIAQTGTAIHQSANRQSARFFADLDEYANVVNDVFSDLGAS